jgi:hypothetical protein
MNILNVECIHVLGQHVLALEVKIVILFKVFPIPLGPLRASATYHEM